MKPKGGSNTKSVDYPFVTPDSMVEVLGFVRKPGWNQVVNAELVKRLGIAPNNEPKVPHALRFLGLIDDTGSHTKESGELKKDYQATLKRLTKEKYAELFQTIPPDMVTRKRLNAFFGKKQTDERRARLFIWLCKEAGIELPNLNKTRENRSGK